MKRVVSLFLSLVAFAAGNGVASSWAAEWPALVRASYEVSFNGFQVGTFDFEAQTEEESYSLSGNARLTLLLGTFTWIGETRAFGLLANHAPNPAAFSFEFNANGRIGSTKVDFDNGSVLDVKHNPKPPQKPDIVPLRDQNKKGVIDPLSAVMLVANYSSRDPCDRRLPIFDGKERFDLLMSYKGEVKVNEQQPSGQPAIAHVCRVKYKPVAGHKADAENSYLATNDGIEVSLRPIPSANIMVPYQITIPTMIGYITIVSRRVEIKSPGLPQIALLH